MPMLSMKDAYDHAKALYDQGSYRAAVRATGVLYKQTPYHMPVVALYVASLLRFQRVGEGIRIAKRSLRHITHKAHRVSLINQLVDGLTQTGKLEDAIELVLSEIQAQPDRLSLKSSYTHLLVMNDQHDQAVEYIDQLMSDGVESLSIATVFGRAVLRTDRRDEAIKWIQRLIKEQPDATNGDLHHAYNSLGHLLDRAKRYDEAMEAFKISNTKVEPDYAQSRAQLLIDTIKVKWTPKQFEGVERPVPAGPRPVFIVGMPRSGTTLTEQIIDAHPKGYGAGELGLISELFQGLCKDPYNPYDTAPDEYDREKLFEAARIYRQETAAMADDDSVELIVDKAPMNFNYLGMIALAFPDAKIIHCQRDPRDNCLSCFFQLLNAGHSYSFDLANCGEYYRNYRAVMKHYKSLLENELVSVPIFENVYEDMVGDQEKRTRELLAFIGLDFDPACLEFHKSGRVAVTLSNDQVRQPMYSSSTKRYERYAKHIGPLVDALGDVLDDEPR